MTAALFSAPALVPAQPTGTTPAAHPEGSAPRAGRHDSAQWGVADASMAMRFAADEIGLDVSGATLVRDVSTVVFRVGDMAVKVHPPTVDAARLRTVYATVAPSPACLHPLTTPVVTGHGVVTLWPWLAGRLPERRTWPRIGALLRTFHATTAATPELPDWQPLSRLADQVAGLPAPLGGILLTARDRLLAEVAEVDSDLGRGVIHGDVSADNVLVHLRRPVFIDLDFVAVGPREYDLVGAAMRHERGELDGPGYAAFCAAYGADVRNWSGFPTVRAVCELGALTFGIWVARHTGRPMPDLQQRVRQWRRDRTRGRRTAHC